MHAHRCTHLKISLRNKKFNRACLIRKQEYFIVLYFHWEHFFFCMYGLCSYGQCMCVETRGHVRCLVHFFTLHFETITKPGSQIWLLTAQGALQIFLVCVWRGMFMGITSPESWRSNRGCWALCQVSLLVKKYCFDNYCFTMLL